MKSIITSLGVGLFLLTAQAQEKNAKAISAFANKTEAEVSINETTGTPSFITFPQDKALQVKGSTAADKAFNFLKENRDLYLLTTVEKALQHKATTTDKLGLKQTVLEQVYKGVPVFDGKLRFHFNQNDNVSSVNGNIVPVQDLNTEPKLTAVAASEIAKGIVKKQASLTPSKALTSTSKLYIFQKGLVQNIKGSVHLVYEVEVTNSFDVREFVYVDAHNGKIVEQFTGTMGALDRYVFQGVNPSELIWKEGDAFPGELNQWQQNEVAASGHVYHLFKNAFGRDSYDNAGGTMITVNLPDSLALCPNAFWNGQATFYCDGSAADDVIAHEWGHAYTQYTSQLIYAYQSGALNESFSDVWGETVDLVNNYEDEDENLGLRSGCDDTDRWQMGEDATAFGDPIRDMWQPSCKQIGASDIGYPDTISDYLCLSRGADSGGVHINSSIPNHAYALLVDGAYYNGIKILGIGLTKAAHLFWRVQSEYLTRTSDFNDFANALQAAAIDLLGQDLEGLSTTETPAGPIGNKFSVKDLLQVQKVIFAIGLREDIDFCEFEPILKPIEPLCDNATNDVIYKEDWENGLGNWTLEQLPVNATTWEPRDWTLETNLPNGRTGTAVFATNPINGDCQEDLENGIIRLQSPEISISAMGDNDYQMAFNHYVATESSWDRNTNAYVFWDGGNVKYSLNGSDWELVPASAFTANAYNATLAEGDNPMQLQTAFSGTNEGENKGSWGTSVVNLTALGVEFDDTIQFRFELGTDGCNGNIGWYVDEIMIYNCESTLSTSTDSLLNKMITVYPNPSANGVFTLKSDAKEDLLNATVYDINGRLIKTVDVSKTNVINLSEASTGIYFMTVQSKTEKGTFKLVKN